MIDLVGQLPPISLDQQFEMEGPNVQTEQQPRVNGEQAAEEYQTLKQYTGRSPANSALNSVTKIQNQKS